VDIHPAAQIGCGILLDHATSFVVGETAIIEDDVSILHEVTLGGTGKETGNRHPIVRSGVLTSVHSFASDPARGVVILGILCFFIGLILCCSQKAGHAHGQHQNNIFSPGQHGLAAKIALST
jgi:hypothetical protein